MPPVVWFSYAPGIEAHPRSSGKKARRHEWQSHPNRGTAVLSVNHWRRRGLNAELYRLINGKRMVRVPL